MRVNSDEVMKAIMSRGGRQLTPKKSKYNNKKTKGYDSAKEAKRAQMLKWMEHSGAISELKEQPRFELVPKQKGERAVHYVADFSYVRDGVKVVEDVKSDFTRKLPVYIIKRKLLLFVYGIRVLET